MHKINWAGAGVLLILLLACMQLAEINPHYSFSAHRGDLLGQVIRGAAPSWDLLKNSDITAPDQKDEIDLIHKEPILYDACAGVSCGAWQTCQVRDNQPACVPTLPRIIRDGDSYFGNPKWVWNLKNLNDTWSPTIIGAPHSIEGPTIGIANNFIALNPNQDILSANNQLWSLPHNYLVLKNWGPWPRDPDSQQYWDRPWLTAQTRYQIKDTTVAVGVPPEYASALKPDARVVTVKTPDNLPVIMTNWQMRHSGVNGYWSVDDGNHTDNIDYLFGLHEVYPDLSVKFGAYRRIPNSVGSYDWIEEPSFTIPHRGQHIFHGNIIYNYLAENNGQADIDEGNYREWVIIYTYFNQPGATLSSRKPTATLVLQPYNCNSQSQVCILAFYTDPDSGQLVFHDFTNKITSTNNPNPIGNDYLESVYIVYQGYWHYISARKIGADIAVTLNSWLNWPSQWFSPTYYFEEIAARFRWDGQQITGLGALPNTAEASEVTYSYNNCNGWVDCSDQQYNLRNIGGKTSDVRTSHGTIIKATATSAPSDSLQYYLPPWKVHNQVGLGKEHKDPWGTWYEGMSNPIELGRNIFGSLSPNQQTMPWGFDFSTKPFSDSDWTNPLGLSKWSIPFGGNMINTHEALILGTNTPRVQTALTQPNDAYKTDIAITTSRGAYNQQSGGTNEGIKYLYAFDNPVNLSQVSAQNPLEIEFLGRCLRIVGYGSATSLSVVQSSEPCQPPPVYECFDSDNGEQPTMAGWVLGNSDGNNYRHLDACTSQTQIREWKCVSQNGRLEPVSVTINCPSVSCLGGGPCTKCEHPSLPEMPARCTAEIGDQFHLACVSQRCVMMPGPGPDRCSTHADCGGIIAQ